MENNVPELISELKKFDNSKGYKLEYDEVRKKLEPVISELSKKGEESLDLLHELMLFFNLSEKNQNHYEFIFQN